MQLRVLRLALVSGILVFGAIVWWLRRNGETPAPSVSPVLLVTAGRIVWGAAVAGSFLLFLRLRQVKKAAQFRTVSIIAWALGEATAVYGAVIYLLAGNSFWYQMGVGFMVLSFLAFPGEPSR